MPTPAVIGAVVVILVIGGLAYATWSSRSASEEWGPMAVAPIGNGDMARTEGVLRISDSCVVLEDGGVDGTSAILVWWRDQVSWDAEKRQILFQKRDDTTLGLGDGQPISVGGSGTLGLPPTLDWVAKPDPSCAVDSYWFVGDVERAPVE